MSGLEINKSKTVEEGDAKTIDRHIYKQGHCMEDDVYTCLLRRHVHRYPEDGSHKMWVLPQLIILFSTGDVSQVTKAIVKDMMHPIGSGLVASVLVEESIREEVIQKIGANLKPMDERLHQHPNYLRSLKLIDRMNCSTIHIEEYEDGDTEKRYSHIKPGSPVVVLDFPQHYFGDKPTAVITMSTFRNFNEVVKLYKREGLSFDSVSVWSLKLAQCFELVTRLPEPLHWTFNSMNVPVDFLIKTPQSNGSVSVTQNMHYELHAINGKYKTIAFPICHDLEN
ncbi:uncharacterized protein [Drosophila pseudoobscura]|uniref:Uncharacterized protein isoform X1 n=2 Tax=pseudoobscura subgroup TaxID=32358 RepID=A0A6I8UY96_DROPS|nr:uncharacterized protein LOC6902765 isoform X1 [Drosophila pseudoobscura]XP_033236203.1 uncharacterized protein LOC6902765 isoform X2 [Drosophila pseudoobscura]